MFISKDFTGNLVKFTSIISFYEGSETEYSPNILGEAVYIPEKGEPQLIKILSYNYITNSLMNVIDNEGNKFSIYCSNYDKVFLII